MLKRVRRPRTITAPTCVSSTQRCAIRGRPCAASAPLTCRPHEDRCMGLVSPQKAQSANLDHGCALCVHIMCLAWHARLASAWSQAILDLSRRSIVCPEYSRSWFVTAPRVALRVCVGDLAVPLQSSVVRPLAAPLQPWSFASRSSTSRATSGASLG